MLPDFVIIGAQKSASTYAHVCLAEHPEVYVFPSEATFFDADGYETRSKALLEASFDHVDRSRIKRIGIKRPSLLGDARCPSRVHEMLPDAQLIAILRNPVERAVSAYFHYANYGFIPITSIEKGMRRLLDGAYEGRYARAWEILEFGLYHKHLSKYLELYDREQLLLLLHDDFRRDSLAAMQRIYKFLQVDENFVPARVDLRPQRVLYSIPRLKWLTLRNPFRFMYYDEGKRVAPKTQTMMDRMMVSAITAVDIITLRPLFGNRKPELSPELQHRLRVFYEADIRRLQDLCGRDLGPWLRTSE